MRPTTADDKGRFSPQQGQGVFEAQLAQAVHRAVVGQREQPGAKRRALRLPAR